MPVVAEQRLLIIELDELNLRLTSQDYIAKTVNHWILAFGCKPYNFQVLLGSIIFYNP